MKQSMYGAGAEYALHSLLILAGRADPVSVADLARFQKIPGRFLAKLFTRMRKAGLVQGAEGIAGGFALARPAGQIRVMEVLAAVDPDRTLFTCAEIRRNCALFGAAPPGWATSGMCRIHLFMSEAEQVLRDFLASKTLADLAGEYERKAPGPFVQASADWFQERKAGRGRPS